VNEISPKQQLMQLITGMWISQALYAAAKLSIADHLESGPQSATELADKAGCHAGALHRLLRALASIGVFAELEGKRFSLTPLGDCLRINSPDSARNSAILISEIFYQAWGEILSSVETGETAFAKVHGLPLFEYLAANPNQAKVFDAGMVSWMKEEADAIVDAYDWPENAKVVDVGGGSGGLLLTLLHHYPHLEGVIFDLPEVIERIEALDNAQETYAACKLEGGDFFISVPKEADIYLLRNIIHDWADDDAVKILGNCREASHPDSKVLLLEYVIPPGNEPFGGKWLDLMMLVGPGGQERDEIEYGELLSAAGLRINRVIPTATEMSIVEAQPV